MRGNETMTEAVMKDHFRMPFLLAFCLLGLAASAVSAQAASACGGVDTSLTHDRKQEYSRLVAKEVGNRVKPGQVEINNFMQSGHWSAVYASTPVSDDGVLFFEQVNGRPQFKDVWGGWADPSERPELVAWAKKLGAPDNLSRCFADIVTE